jgi:lipoate---protein ligase
MSWIVSRHRGDAGELHHLEPPTPVRRVMVMEPTGPAVALGSTQSPEVLDALAVEAAGLTVTRRHSGGGLVLLRPGEIAWVDVPIPPTDPLWQADVGASFIWLGEAWATALGGVVGSAPTIHHGAPLRADLGRIVCFAGIGSGEVLADGRKVVGLSQRRTRQFARFQCLVHGRFEAGETTALLAPDLREGETGALLADRLGDAVGVVTDVTVVVDSLIEVLSGR